MTEQDIQQDAPEETPAEQVEAPEAEQEAPEAVTPEPVKGYSDDDAEEARLFGWKSPDQWHGDKPDGYIDNPKEFLDRVKRSRIFQTMEEKMAEQERKLAAVNDRALERQKAEHERKLQEVSARQRKAVEEADTDAYDAAEKERLDLMRAQPQEQPKAPEVPTEIKEYHEKNEWAKDPVLWHEAVQAVNVGLQNGLVKEGDAAGQLKFAEERMFAKYPHLKPQEAPAPKRQRVDGGGLAGGSPSGRGAFDKLPADAKSTFQRFVTKGIFEDTAKDKEEYAREYNNA